MGPIFLGPIFSGPNFLRTNFLGHQLFWDQICLDQIFWDQFFWDQIFLDQFFWTIFFGNCSLLGQFRLLKKHYNWNNLIESANLFHPKLIFYRGGTKMWKDSIRTTILRIVRFYVRCLAHFFAISFHKLFLASLPPKPQNPKTP